MKNWQKKVLAVVLAVALIVTGFATSTFTDGNSNKVVKETTVSKTNDNKSDVAKADIVSNKDTKTEKSKEPNVSENKNNVDNKIGDPDKKIDYQKIIRETKDEDYRKAVKVKKGGFVVIRKEKKNSGIRMLRLQTVKLLWRIPLRIMMEKNIIRYPTK